jgi:hypothetical protein
MATSVGTIYAEVRATTTGLQTDMADAVKITKQGSTAMAQALGVVEPGVKRLGQSAQGTGREISELTHRARLLSENLLQQVSPGFASVVQASTMAARGFQGFSFGATAAAVGATAVVAVLGQMIQAMDDAARKTVELNTALRSMDIGALRTQIAASIKEIDILNESSENVIGTIRNFFSRGWALAMGGGDPTVEAAKAIAARNKLIPLENQLTGAKSAGAEATARQTLAEQMLARTQLELNIPAFETMIRVLGSIIDLQEQSGIAAATAAAQTKRAAAEALAASQEELAGLDKALQSTITQIRTAAEAQRLALGARAGAGRQAIRAAIRGTAPDTGEASAEQMAEILQAMTAAEPFFQRRVSDENFGEASAEQMAEITKAIASAHQPMLSLADDMTMVTRSAKLMGIDFDRAAAELAVVTSAILNFDFTTQGAEKEFARLNARFTELTNLTKQKEYIHDFFSTLTSGLSSAVNAVLQGQQTVAQGFANLGRTIAAGLIDSVINRGLKVVEKALDEFLKQAQESGLWKALLSLLGIGVQTAAAALAPTATTGVGVSPTLAAEGGLVTKPTLAIVGESGPELIVPLSQLRGSGGVTVNVMNYSGAQVDTQQKTGPNGQNILDIVIGAVKTAVANGSFDRVMAPYNLSRQPVGR